MNSYDEILSTLPRVIVNTDKFVFQFVHCRIDKILTTFTNTTNVKPFMYRLFSLISR